MWTILLRILFTRLVQNYNLPYVLQKAFVELELVLNAGNQVCYFQKHLSVFDVLSTYIYIYSLDGDNN